MTNKKRRLHKRKNNGSDGFTPTFRGLDPASVDITITIWTPDQFALWQSMIPVIFPNPNANIDQLSALDIGHPATGTLNIASIIIEDISGPSDGPVKGAKQWALKCIEYIPRPAAPKSAVKNIDSSVSVTKNLQYKPGDTKNNPAPPSQTGHWAVSELPAAARRNAMSFRAYNSKCSACALLIERHGAVLGDQDAPLLEESAYCNAAPICQVHEDALAADHILALAEAAPGADPVVTSEIMRRVREPAFDHIAERRRVLERMALEVMSNEK